MSAMMAMMASSVSRIAISSAASASLVYDLDAEITQNYTAVRGTYGI